MKSFLKNAFAEAKKNPQMIVFPEAELDDRIIEAAIKIAKQKIAYPILLGNEEVVTNKLKTHSKKIPEFIDIHDYHAKSSQREYYAAKLFELRKHKGITLKQANEMLNDINYYGVMMLHEDHCHAMISGTTFSTADTIRPALQIIKTKEKFHKVSGFFFMVLENKVLIFADCAINVNPNSHDLADIAIDSALTAKRFGIEPKVAFLSFSTNGSADHPEVDKIREALAIARSQEPDIIFEGEMQVDSAIVPSVSNRKWPNNKIAGEANVLIFPDLNSGNIAYKLVERLAKAKAVGPILQGLKKPVNDLSRGCSVEDIVNMAAITSIEAQDLPYSS
jgi:phosphate acetyltransferase